MPTQSSLNGTPVEFTTQDSQAAAPGDQSEQQRKVVKYVVEWRNRLRNERIPKLGLWNECWALYRGQDDFTDKEDWQSKIVLPKAWGTVKQATNVIKRFLSAAKNPWGVDDTNNQDPTGQLRAEKMTELSRVFMEKANWLDELGTGLECGFIIGPCIWKVGWALRKRTRLRVDTQMVAMPGQPMGAPGLAPTAPGPVPAAGMLQQQPVSFQDPQGIGQSPLDILSQQNSQYPTQLPQEALLPPGSLQGAGAGGGTFMLPQKRTVREEVQEGELVIAAVDPYNFYWLPGSKFNRWTGTIEEMEVPKWQLLLMARDGFLDPELVKSLGPMKLDENTQQSALRFGELPQSPGAANSDTGSVKLLEFFGPLVIDGEVIEEHAHVLIANDTTLLLNGQNDRWHQKPPYIGWSPLSLPFRTDGVGLVENVRSIDKALSGIVNLGVDTLMYRLMPLFELTPDVYENPEDLKTGLTPGKILRRNSVSTGQELGLRPIEFQDVSSGAITMAGVLDRAHQEGGLVSELQQSLPRWSGAQTATETQAIQANQDSFFGAMAADLEKNGIGPLVEMVLDTLLQYLDTARDPRVASILGMDQLILAGMSQPEVMELVAGDYEVTATGLTDNLEKAEMLQNLIQLMNLIGQNPQSWLPYLNQDALLRRILESFRPHIHDIEEIIADPQTVAANKAAMQQAEQSQQALAMIPQLAQMAHEIEQSKAASAAEQQNTEFEQQARIADQAIAAKQALAPQPSETE